MTHRTGLRVLGMIGILVIGMIGAPAAVAAPPTSAACDSRTNNTHKKLLECVTLEGVREHQAALQEIADDNGGTRAAGTPGYDEERRVRRRADDGRRLQRHAQQLPVRVRPGLHPGAADARGGHLPDRGVHRIRFRRGHRRRRADRHQPRLRRARTRVAARVRTPKRPLAPRSSRIRAVSTISPGSRQARSRSIQRGGCSFALKASNAQAAGAGGVIIFNQGDTPPARGPHRGERRARLRRPVPRYHPGRRRVVRQRRGPLRAGLDRTRQRRRRPQNITINNVMAESKAGDPNNVVMAGAHLDSVLAGPGHQRQRLRLCRDPRDRRADVQGQAAQQAALRLVGRGGGRPRRLDRLRERPQPGREATRSPSTSTSTWSVRRTTSSSSTTATTPMASAPARARRLGADREDLRALLRQRRRAVQGHRLHRPVRLRPVHRERASRRAACSPAPRASRPPRRPPSGVARQASSTTPAITSPATRTPTTTTTPST